MEEKEIKTLVNDERYEGTFVALKPFTYGTVISSSSTAIQVIEESRKKGVHEPVVVFIPMHGSTHIYNAY